VAVDDLKAVLGLERIVWVDDVFHHRDRELERLVLRHPAVVESFEELAGLMAGREYADVGPAAVQAIRDLPPDRAEAIEGALMEADARHEASQELPRSVIDAACDLLGVATADRLTFEQGERFAATIGEGRGAEVALIVDLKEAGGLPDRGLDLLGSFHLAGFAGVAFILTHEATVATEGAQESELTAQLVGKGVTGMPVTVIAKDRLKDDGDVDAAISIALKRAGLRRALRPVLSSAGEVVSRTIAELGVGLLALEPERLERYVLKVAETEGEAELHVIERALSAGLSRGLRSFMSIDDVARQSARMLRALGGIPLDVVAGDAGQLLEGLRQAEVSDDGGVVNTALRPLSNGDVFEMDRTEPGVGASDKFFILLAQPCDVQLRPGGNRVSEMGMLVPLSPATAPEPPGVPPVDVFDANKDPELPFRLGGRRLRMRLREIAYARLAVLDLATFRDDGRVMFALGQTMPPDLLPWQAAIFPDATQAAAALLAGPPPGAPPQALADEAFLMTLSAKPPWRQSRMACHLDKATVGTEVLPRRVTWRLRRTGRVRPPYATFMLERVLGLLGRAAFDMDYSG